MASTIKSVVPICIIAQYYNDDKFRMKFKLSLSHKNKPKLNTLYLHIQ